VLHSPPPPESSGAAAGDASPLPLSPSPLRWLLHHSLILLLLMGLLLLLLLLLHQPARGSATALCATSDAGVRSCVTGDVVVVQQPARLGAATPAGGSLSMVIVWAVASAQRSLICEVCRRPKQMGVCGCSAIIKAIIMQEE
jgi:hypothetical protein